MLLNRCPQKYFKREQGEIQVLEIEYLIDAHMYVPEMRKVLVSI